MRSWACSTPTASNSTHSRIHLFTAEGQLTLLDPCITVFRHASFMDTGRNIAVIWFVLRMDSITKLSDRFRILERKTYSLGLQITELSVKSLLQWRIPGKSLETFHNLNKKLESDSGYDSVLYAVSPEDLRRVRQRSAQPTGNRRLSHADELKSGVRINVSPWHTATYRRYLHVRYYK